MMRFREAGDRVRDLAEQIGEDGEDLMHRASRTADRSYRKARKRARRASSDALDAYYDADRAVARQIRGATIPTLLAVAAFGFAVSWLIHANYDHD